MKLTQKNFDDLINILNHKITKIENDIKWIKYIGYYFIGLFTSLVIGGAIVL
ncbi:hypothetical protein LCGC14_1866760 [marine sediment metagenome]|uniref:Uncharacterized protein n=1 Tax=marine sediment metagenome TaxID=412755 RepID=A0A0F9G660_9ZZZZ